MRPRKGIRVLDLGRTIWKDRASERRLSLMEVVPEAVGVPPRPRVTGANGGRGLIRVMGSEVTLEELAELLREAQRAHHDHEQRTGQRDEDWASWYAQYLLDRLGDRR